MDPYRKAWNEGQQALQEALKLRAEHARAVELFLRQHAAVNSARVAPPPPGLISFEDAVWEGLSDADARRVPPGALHSIAWMAWHVARCEDITFNLLVAGSPQVLTAGGWLEKTRSPVAHTANELDAAGMEQFNAAIDLPALREYRAAVGLRTRQIVQALQPGDFARKVDPARVERIWAEGAAEPEAHYVVDYWAARTFGGLAGMPATRHPFVHWTEAVEVRRKL